MIPSVVLAIVACVAPEGRLKGVPPAELDPPGAFGFLYTESQFGDPSWGFSGFSRGPLFRYKSLTFCPDGKWLVATRSFGGAAEVWEVATGKYKTALSPRYSSHTSGFAFAPDSKTITVVGRVARESRGQLQPTAMRWETATWKCETFPLAKTEPGYFAAVAFSPDGSMLAWSGWLHPVVLWDPATGTGRSLGDSHFWPTESVVFSPDGRVVATGDRRGEIRLWDTKTDKAIATLKGEPGQARTLVFTPDGKTLFAAGSKGLTRWNLEMQKGEVTELKDDVGFWSEAFSPDQKLLATGGDKGDVLLWDVTTGKQVGALSKHKNRVFSVAFSPDGKYVASGSWEPRIKIDRVPTKPAP